MPVEHTFAVEMPLGSNVLCVQMQNGAPYIWVEVDSDEGLVSRYFRIVGTGHDLPTKPHKYIGTFQTSEGRFVWHLYDLRG